MLRMALPGSERPSREGRLPCASPELRALISWHGDEATSERTGSSVQLCGPASLRLSQEATLEPSRGCSRCRAGAQYPATLSHVEGGDLRGGRVGLSWNKQPPNFNLGASAHHKFFSLTPPSQSSAPQSHSGLQAGRGSPAGSSQGAFLVTETGEDTTGKSVFSPEGTPFTSSLGPLDRDRAKEPGRETQMGCLT